MSKFICLKHGSELLAADAGAEAAMAKIKQGALVMVDVTQPRNLRRHRLYWSLMQKVAENLDGVTAETVSDVVKIRIGHVNTLKTISGLVQTPKSISFSAMDETAFSDFFERAVAFICADVIPGLDRDDLTREVLEMVGGRAA